MTTAKVNFLSTKYSEKGPCVEKYMRKFKSTEDLTISPPSIRSGSRRREARERTVGVRRESRGPGRRGGQRRRVVVGRLAAHLGLHLRQHLLHPLDLQCASATITPHVRFETRETRSCAVRKSDIFERWRTRPTFSDQVNGTKLTSASFSCNCFSF